MRYLLLAIIPLPLLSLATTHMCPNTLRYVDTGMTLDSVLSQCGAPTKRIDHKPQPAQSSTVTEWVYASSYPRAQKLTLQFENNQLVTLQLNGATVESTTFCGNSLAKGTDEGSVLATCGRPTAVNLLRNHTDPQTHTTLIYQPQDYMPALTLEFINNTLIN